MIVFKCLHGLALSYLADDCILVSTEAGRRHLRSTNTKELSAQRTRTVVGARVFAVSAAVICSKAQTDVVHPDILAEAENFHTSSIM